MVRPALPADAESIAIVHVSAWRAAYAGLMPAELLANLDEAQRARSWRAALEAGKTILLSEESGALCGFCLLMPAGAELRDAYEIRAIYVSPERWRSGHGSKLVTAARERATAEGFRSLVLWVLSSNAPARAFYEREGFRHDGAEKVDSLFGAPLHEIRYRTSW
jgi:ribosomal protein S18 acetylase RimI-like enzyme